MLTTHDYENIYRRVIELTNKMCRGRILFTFGGGYSLSAAPRIWTILYLLLFDLEIPYALPDKWRKRWSDKIDKKLPILLHDPNPAYEPIPRKPEIEKHNRELIQRITDAVAPDWL
jgi:acetoin utilization protein AcuC